MLWKRKQIWKYFDTGLIALKYQDAKFLKDWYFKVAVSGKIADSFELIDLQRYKIVSAKKKVQLAMSESKNSPFVFFACKN
jgi:hypothetical protein